ncbi:hypothetical protein Tco_0291262 [Tanacetum coccineum]
MHASKDGYLINTLRFVSAKEATQIYGAILPESLTSPKMKETKAYKTYLGFPIGATPPNIARKFKKASPSKKDLNLNLVPEKVNVTRGKGIELISKVALTEDAQFEEVRRKSMRDFHKTHPSGSGTVTKTAPSAAKIKPSITNEGTGDEDDSNNEHESRSEGSDQERDSGDDNTQFDSEEGSDSEHGTIENESGFESDQEENEEDDETDEEEKNDEFVRTPSNDTDDEDETKIKHKAEGDEDKGMDDTTNLLYDDVDISLNEQVDTDDGVIQKEGTYAEMTNIHQGNENPEISQVIEDAHVTLSTIP